METMTVHHCHFPWMKLAPYEMRTLYLVSKRLKVCRKGVGIHEKLAEYDAGVEEAEEEASELWPTCLSDPQGRNGKHDSKRGSCTHG